MTFTDAKWQDDERNVILVVVDGKQMCVPTDIRNRHYAAIVTQGVPIADPDAIPQS
jgi:hypothetical protein